MSATLLAGAAGLAPFAAMASSYPGRPITIIYPYASGSASDALARQVAEIIAKALGQPVLVESRPGAGGSIGLEHVARSAPDGYTLAFTASGTIYGFELVGCDAYGYCSGAAGIRVEDLRNRDSDPVHKRI